ncbi:DASS family sodium-coupled anion symporter [Microaerobacter geothermalis]|uniref:SLC13 family permease n=1 Tax=Microaerobacter geothermalis TaxID=674972 RepID=UPI001F3F7C63|nr:DASS family sodium-coupled anion symporter [Microaerobacter geothermalis]MCF6094045.1 DASS family sodium-coupled anion symporter [Microaerobacter geothermalis]
MRKFIIIILSAVAFAIIYFELPSSVPYEAKMTIAITTGAIILWVFEPIPFSLTAILVLFLLPVTGSVSFETALSGFASPAIFLIVAGMMLAKGVESTSLGERLAYFLLYHLGHKKGGVLAGIILVPQLMAFFIPAAAVRTTMVLPITFSIVSILGLTRENPMTKQLMLGLTYGATISGTAIIPAAIGNVITVELINYYLGKQVTYLDWLIIGFPLWLFMIPITWYVLYKSFPVESDSFPDMREKIGDLIKEMGPLNKNEMKAIFILVFVFLLWTMESIHGWPPAIPALMGAVLMGLPKIGIVNWNEMLEVKFGTLLLLAITLSLGKALYETGAVDSISNWVKTDVTLFLFSSPAISVLTVSVFTQFLHKVTSNVSTAVLTVVPIVLAIGAQVGAPVMLLGVVAGITSLFGFLFVVETIPGVIVCGTGFLSQKDFFKPGVWLTLASIIVTYLLAITWWNWLGYV